MHWHQATVLTFLIRRFRWALPAAALASVVSGVCSVLVVTQINAALSSAGVDLYRAGVGFAVAAVAAALAGMFARILFQRLRQRATAELRQYISARVLQAPLRQLEEVGSARVFSALSEPATRVSEFFVIVPALLTNGAIVIGCLAYLVLLSPRIFLVTVPFLLLAAPAYHVAHLRAIRHLRAGAEEQERLFEHFRSLTEGAKELRLNGAKRQTFSDDVLTRSIDSVCRHRTAGMSIFVASSTWGHFLIYAFLGVVLFIVAGGAPDRAHVLTGFALVIVYLVDPLQSLLLSLPDINFVRVAAEQVEKLTQELRATELPATQVPPSPFRSLVLRAVKHRYFHEQSNELFALGPIDLHLRPGEVIFIVGGNGSGKTTLAKVLVGLYPQEEGAILLNDELIDDSGRDRYRQQFSAIFGDFHLFETLLEQGRPELDARGNHLLARLHLHNKVQLQRGTFTTRALSQGQRKRLALVVACLEDRPILVFDEWAADQDPTFKNVFYHEILQELREQGKTVIVISHDDRYFAVADRLIQLESGQIVALQRASSHNGKFVGGPVAAG